MIRKTMLALAAAAILAPALVATEASAGCRNWYWCGGYNRDIRSDRRDIFRDRGDVREDRRDIAHDRADLARDLRYEPGGHSEGLGGHPPRPARLARRLPRHTSRPARPALGSVGSLRLLD